MFWIATCSEVIGGVVFAFAFAPAFYKSGATTIYEFIDQRFQHTPLRVLCSLLSLIQLQFSLVIVFHVAVKVLSEAIFRTADLQSLIYAAIILTAVTILNIVLGGMKAAVIVDTIQYLIVLAGVIAMLVIGLQTAGDLRSAFSTLKKNGRLNLLDFTFDIWQRHTFWNLFLGGFTSIMANNMTQTTFLRLRSVGSMPKAILSTLLFVMIKWTLVSILIFTGLAMYLNFVGCDFKLNNSSEMTLVIDFVQERVSSIPLMSGLLLAAMMALAISTLSADITSIATIIWNDFCCHCSTLKNLKHRKHTWAVRILEILFAVITAASGFTVTEDRNLLSFLIAITGSLLGAILAVIILAVYSKSARGTSVMVALLVSVPLTLWWSYGNGAYIYSQPLQLNSQCTNYNSSLAIAPSPAKLSGSFIEENFYNLSYQLFFPISCMITLFLSQIFTWIEIFPQCVATKK